MPVLPHVKLAIVDDHTLFRKGMVSLITMINPDYEILFEADNGIDLQKKLNNDNLPDIILLDINMPGMNGFETVGWLNAHFPPIKILVVSMIDKEESILRMIKLGVKGYLSKDVEPEILDEAIRAILEKDIYYTDFVTGNLLHTLKTGKEKELEQNEPVFTFTIKEKEFIQLICTELTYPQIADKMFMSLKTIEGYRYTLFKKLQVKTRVGLALFAVKTGMVIL